MRFMPHVRASSLIGLACLLLVCLLCGCAGKKPAVDGAPVSLSCKVRQMIELGSHDMFLGEIVAVRVRKDLLDGKGSLHMEKARLVAYSHGLYHRIGDVMGFFGYSVARPEVLERRMKEIKG